MAGFTHMVLPVVCLILFLGFILRRRRNLRSVPGPWLASITNIWRAFAVHQGSFHIVDRELHDAYGPIVRIGPNCISVADPYEIPNIYGIHRLFPKSQYYTVSQSMVDGKRIAGLFQTTDENVHKSAKRLVANAYAMSTLLDYEPLVDSTSLVFLEQLRELFAKTRKVCDLGKWLQWYAFDVIGEITFSRRLGFLEEARDVNDLISILNHAGWYTAVFGQIPWMDILLEKNWLASKLHSPRKFLAARFVMSILQDRLSTDENESKRSQQDFLAKFNGVVAAHGDKVLPSMYLGWCMSNINAGSDTTAISLRAIFYFLLKNPPAMEKLMAELKDADLSELPTWRETHNLPYLNAVVREAMRLHTPVGLVLERVVPDEGVTLCGKQIPAGTIVGCNPYVIHQSVKVYGRLYDVDEFWPERWIESDEASRAEMDRSFMAFGSGKRTCIGKHISQLEIYKLVPLLLKNFKITLASPEKDWHVWNSFFVHQDGFEVLLEPR